MNRRQFLHFSTLMAARAPRPNVIVMVADDQRYDTIHALGNREIRTPALDSLVGDGVAFTNAYTMGAMTGATCVPSRAMLLSGRSLFDLNGNGNVIPPAHVTMPEAFRKAGYYTFHVGKTHQDRASFLRMFSGGDRIFGFDGYFADHFRMPVHDFDPTGKYPKENAYLAGGPDGSVRLPLKADAEPRGPHSSELFADAAIRFLRSDNAKQPFFLYLAFHAPHDTRRAPPEYHAMYPPDKLSLPPSFLPEHPFDNGDLKVRDEKLAPWPRTPQIVRQHLSDYYAMITHMDAQIGRILKTLGEAGHERDTIVVFTGDSGLAVGNHGLFGKQNLYEADGIKVPLLFRGPGVPKTKKRAALCYLFDIFPTLCDMAAIPIPASVEGKSLVPALTSGAADPRQSLYFAYRNYQRAVRDMRYKLIEYVAGGSRHTQLFDLAADPHEIRNLAKDPKLAGVLGNLRRLLEAQRSADGEIGAEFWKSYSETKRE
jgi:arylsulfatase A-like enzyme